MVSGKRLERWCEFFSVTNRITIRKVCACLKDKNKSTSLSKILGGFFAYLIKRGKKVIRLLDERSVGNREATEKMIELMKDLESK